LAAAAIGVSIAHMDNASIGRNRAVIAKHTGLRLPMDPAPMAVRLGLRLLPRPGARLSLHWSTLTYDDTVHPNDQSILIARGCAMHLRRKFQDVHRIGVHDITESLYPTLGGAGRASFEA
jgi:hypothetical protein